MPWLSPLQLCLQVHSDFYAGQELYLLPFSTVNERGFWLPFELKEVCTKYLPACASHLMAQRVDLCAQGLVKNVMELRRCTFGACERRAAARR